MGLPPLCMECGFTREGLSLGCTIWSTVEGGREGGRGRREGGREGRREGEEGGREGYITTLQLVITTHAYVPSAS